MPAKKNPAAAVLPQLPPQPITVTVLAEKYAKGDEVTPDDVRRRVAKALAAVEAENNRSEWERIFFETLQNGFVPAGRINSAAGTSLNATLINCFVQPVGDSISEVIDGVPGIYPALQDAAETMRRGGGVGYDFSNIRPRGAWVKSTNSHSSGPISYMRVYDRSCETVESAGARRGAQMAMLRCEHPDIEEFIHAKDEGDLTNFNISMSVTDKFMRAVEFDTTFELVHKAEPGIKIKEKHGSYQREDGMWVYRTVQARDLWEQMMRSTYDHAEPGIIFIDRVNQENNLHYCEVIAATNPCAEQPLPPYGCCCLGSIDLTRFVRNPFTPQAAFDMPAFEQIVRVATRMLDNVLDVTIWPLQPQYKEAMNKRRIGLGFLGLGDALIMLRLRYNSAEGLAMGEKIAEAMRNAAYATSIELGEEKGVFPLFSAGPYLESGFCKRLPENLRTAIRGKGLRNSHLLSIAPTGTITLAFADNASNGIEPPFSLTYTRKKRNDDNTKTEFQVHDHAYRLYLEMFGDSITFDEHGQPTNLPDYFVTAMQMSATEHMEMMVAVQPYIDTAISKTVNVPEDYPFEDFVDLYKKAYKAGLKGMATYRPNNVLGSVLSVSPTPVAAPQTIEAVKAPDVTASLFKGDADAALVKAPPPDIDPMTIQFVSRPEADLDAKVLEIEYWSTEGKHSIYVTVSFMKVEGRLNGQDVEIERPIEFFVQGDQFGDGQQWIASNMRTMAMLARSAPNMVGKMLSNMRKIKWAEPPVRFGWITTGDGRKPRFHSSDVAAVGFAIQELLIHRGFLNDEGHNMPTERLVEIQRLKAPVVERIVETLPALTGVTYTAAASMPGTSSTDTASEQRLGGRECPDCGAPALHKVDGCEKCSSCGYVGACG